MKCIYAGIHVYTYVYTSMHACMYVSMYPIFKSQAVQARPLNAVPHLHHGGDLKSRQI